MKHPAIQEVSIGRRKTVLKNERGDNDNIDHTKAIAGMTTDREEEGVVTATTVVMTRTITIVQIEARAREATAGGVTTTEGAVEIVDLGGTAMGKTIDGDVAVRGVLVVDDGKVIAEDAQGMSRIIEAVCLLHRQLL